MVGSHKCHKNTTRQNIKEKLLNETMKKSRNMNGDVKPARTSSGMCDIQQMNTRQWEDMWDMATDREQ